MFWKCGSVVWTISNMISLYSDLLLAPHPVPKLEDRPLSVVHDCVFNVLQTTLDIFRLPSIRNLRTLHGMVKMTIVSKWLLKVWRMWTGFVLLIEVVGFVNVEDCLTSWGTYCSVEWIGYATCSFISLPLSGVASLSRDLTVMRERKSRSFLLLRCMHNSRLMCSRTLFHEALTLRRKTHISFFPPSIFFEYNSLSFRSLPTSSRCDFLLNSSSSMVTAGSFLLGKAGGPWSLPPSSKGKVHSRTGHEGPEGEKMCLYSLFNLGSRLGGCSTPRAGRITTGKDPVPFA